MPETNNSNNDGKKKKTARRQRSTSKKTNSLQQYNVILLNDSKNTLDDVKYRISQIMKFSQQVAHMKAMEANDQGSSILLTTHKERAEMYKEQFHGYKINVDIKLVSS